MIYLNLLLNEEHIKFLYSLLKDIIDSKGDYLEINVLDPLANDALSVMSCLKAAFYGRTLKNLDDFINGFYEKDN